MAETVPHTTGRMTRSMARSARTPSAVQVPGSEKAVSKTKKASAGKSAGLRAALFDISNKETQVEQTVPAPEVETTPPTPVVEAAPEPVAPEGQTVPQPEEEITLPTAVADAAPEPMAPEEQTVPEPEEEATLPTRVVKAAPEPVAPEEQTVPQPEQETTPPTPVVEAAPEPVAPEAVQESSDADLTMDEVLELEPEEPRGPPTTPDPSFFESAPTNESHDEILVDYEPFEECVPKTPAASAVPEPKEAICPAEEAICQTETPAAAPTEEGVSDQEACNTGGSRWAMASPYDSTTPSQWMTTELLSPAAESHAVLSKVVNEDYDPRSLRQIRAEIAKQSQKKAASVAAPSEAEPVGEIRRAAEAEASQYEWEEADDEEEEEYYEDEEEYCEDEEEYYEDMAPEADDLTELMNGMSIAQGHLRGVPAPQGKHIRFSDGTAEVSPSSHRIQLKGMPEPTGSHVYFD